MSTFCIKTLGCKVNQYESQVVRENFLKAGYTEAEGFDEADICVVNTCTVTSISDSKSLRLIRGAVNRDKCVVVTGCMAEDKDLDLSKLGGSRFIVKNKDKYKIPEIINSTPNPQPQTPNFSITGLKDHTRVFVKVQDGCDNACSYCKVRIVRGRSRSRLPEEVLNECRGLIKNNTKEIVLTGICLGAYGRELSKDLNLSRLINEICKIEGNWRLRLSSVEPKDAGEDLIREIQNQDKVCKHIHLPFQSGDNSVLKKMARPYKRTDYLNIVRALKDAIPDIAISTDIMVGFPGETEEMFRNTMDFISDVRPMRMHVFPFSKRKGTKAYNYKSDIPVGVKKKREDGLMRLAGELAREYTNNFIDKEVEVLVEHKRSDDGCLQGYTDRYIKAYLEGPDSLKGQLINPRLTLTNQKTYGILLSHL